MCLSEIDFCEFRVSRKSILSCERDISSFFGIKKQKKKGNRFKSKYYIWYPS